VRFWTREIAGWTLLFLGLAGFYACAVLFFNTTRIWETTGLTVISIFVFRGGIHLIKVAVAARICQQAQERLFGEDTGAAVAPPPRARSTRQSQGSGIRGQPRL
jgi:hypothetical protein